MRIRKFKLKKAHAPLTYEGADFLILGQNDQHRVAQVRQGDLRALALDGEDALARLGEVGERRCTSLRKVAGGEERRFLFCGHARVDST